MPVNHKGSILHLSVQAIIQALNGHRSISVKSTFLIMTFSFTKLKWSSSTFCVLDIIELHIYNNIQEALSFPTTIES